MQILHHLRVNKPEREMQEKGRFYCKMRRDDDAHSTLNELFARDLFSEIHEHNEIFDF